MGLSNQEVTTTITAGADLSACQYLAIALDDGLVAANSSEAIGILINKPKAAGEAATIAWSGESMFKAGAAINKGAMIAVTTSGWFITAGSGGIAVGRNKVAVTSGSIGTGIFNFTGARVV